MLARRPAARETRRLPLLGTVLAKSNRTGDLSAMLDENQTLGPLSTYIT